MALLAAFITVMSIRRRASGTSDDWLMLLEGNYHHLCRSVRPEAFFSWLRCKGVFTLQDQEEVQHKYVTTIMKSGHLIDIIKTKGYRGFVAFMEVVEYIYPETFSIITGRQPRKPPKEFEPNVSIGCSILREKRGHALSAEILGQMGDLVNVLSNANACKREELNKLQSYVRKLQEENKTMCDENHSLLLKFKDAQEEIDQLKQKLTVLMSKHECDAAERSTYLDERERLCALKDKYMAENQKLREERDDLSCKMRQLSDLEICQTCRTRVSSPFIRFKDENFQFVKDKEIPVAQAAEPNMEAKNRGNCSCYTQTSISADFKENQSATDQRIHDIELVMDDLEKMKQKDWENQFSLLQERYNCLLTNLEEVKTERNQMRHKLDDLQSVYEKEREENQRLVTDCSKYLEKFCHMEGQMTSLKQEIDEMQAVAGTVNPSTKNMSNCRRVLLHNGTSATGSIPETEESTNDKTQSSDSTDCQHQNVTSSRQAKVIDQTPGLCPNIKRQLVVTDKQSKQHSASKA